MSKPRIIATFTPQAWVNDYAMSVDPNGPTTADLTDHIAAMGEAAMRELRDDDYDTDDLRHAPGAPAWWAEWSGPFYIAVADSIADYLAATEPAQG
jgi:hypothetical protein